MLEKKIQKKRKKAKRKRKEVGKNKFITPNWRGYVINF